MFKGKHAVALVLMFVAGSAMASNFRVADQIYLPAGGHFTGGRGETWITDVWISNLHNEAVDVSAFYSTGALGTTQEFSKYFTLAANEHKEIIDYFAAPRSSGGLALSTAPNGQVIFNGCKAGGNCDINTCPNGLSTGVCPDFRNISVEARVYAIPPGASSGNTYGQLFAGIPWYNFVSTDAASAGLDKVFIVGLRNNGPGFGSPGTFRTNIGLTNASQFSSTRLLVKLFDKNGAQTGTYTSTILSPLGTEQRQIGSMFSAYNGSTAVGGYVTVEQVSVVPTGGASAAGCPNGCPSFLAYGSLIDNGSDDATTLEAQYFAPLSDTAQQCIYNLNCKSTTPKLRRTVRQK